MKRIHSIIGIVALFLLCIPAGAQKILNGEGTIRNIDCSRKGQTVTVKMDIDVSGINVPSNQGVKLTPTLQSDGSTISLPSVILLGNRRYIYYRRNQKTLTEAGNQVYGVYKASADTLKTIHYVAAVPYQKSIDGAPIEMQEETFGCCNTAKTNAQDHVGSVALAGFVPAFAYIKPQAEAVKARTQSASAKVSFEINKTILKPDFNGNRPELKKIQDAVSLVKNDPDVKIQQVKLTGYASPDGPYANNARLAKGRTQAVADYIRQMENVSNIIVASVPEDWEGFNQLISNGNLSCKDEILKIANRTDLQPDEKEKAIKAHSGSDFAYIRDNVYPSLRHTDCLIDYTVRGYNEEETGKILKEHPQNLSLQELYNYANKFQTGSDDFCDVFQTAVRLFPNDPTANLNAANVALSHKDLRSAQAFLAKAGNTPEAVNARGVLAQLQGNTDEALKLFQQAADSGLQAAKDNIQKLQ